MKTMIYIESKRKSMEKLREKYPDAMIIDVTSHAEDEFVQLSPSILWAVFLFPSLTPTVCL